MTAVLKERYDTAVRDELRKQFSYGNVMQIPKVEKIVLNIGMGEIKEALKYVVGDAQQFADRVISLAFSHDGNLYGIPKDFNTLALFYDPGVFDRAQVARLVRTELLAGVTRDT